MSLDLSKAAPKLELIVHTYHGSFPREGGGISEEGTDMEFQHNFSKALLAAYIKVIAENAFPKYAFGIGEKATGYNEDEDYEFPVPDCYAFYLGRVEKADYQRFSKLLEEETKDPKFRDTQPWVVKKQYQG
jgi:hypothetical protein